MKQKSKIPKGWVEARLKDIGTFDKGIGISKEQTSIVGYPCVRYGEIYTKYNFKIKNFISFIPKEISLISKQILKGDILFTGSGETAEEIAKCVACLHEGIAYAGGDIIIFKINDKKQNSLFYSYFFNTIGRKQINRLGEGISVVHIYPEELSNINITIPPIKEQEKIVEILELWDKAIETTKKLIEQKKLQKKYLMQKLLTGKIRLKGFKDKWKNMTLDDLLIERKEFSIKTEKYPLMAFIANKGIAEKGNRYNREFLVNNEVDKKYKRTEYGDFIYSSNNLETGSIGVNTFGKATISPVYSIFFTTENTNSSFIGYILTQREFINKMIKWRQGVTYGQWKIHETDFLKIKIKIPNLLEQNEIVKVLSTADNQIKLLEQKLLKLELEKKGLMQKLLTGQIRV